ncbi:flagellin [Caulobacter sp. KR2-114]|uniref:flagellin n=1 Tax=Caulobacter sp. KR2-114 TaxID=3400912 RepID=UPI003C09351C
MSTSVNTNVGAMVALQNLNNTTSQLASVQSIISTGLKVASAKDDGATWAIAQNQRATASSLDSVKDSLNRASSVTDVALAAGSQISDLLSQMQSKALSASDASLDTASRAALNTDFISLRNQINQVASNASFNGINLIKSGATDITALANSSGSSVLTVNAQDLSVGGANVTVSATGTIGTVTQASAMIATVQTSINKVSAALAKMGTASKSIGSQLTFVGKLQDTITAGVGNLVDADLAKESATLQALQTKQQLGIQALSIANSASSSLLGLFR